MIYEQDLVFTLHTLQTTYLFRINETHHLEHLYYGKRLRNTTHIEPLIDKHTIPTGNALAYDAEHPALSLDNICLEYSSYGKGDYRENAVLFNGENGERVADFIYKEYRIIKGKPRILSGLPESYGDATQCTTLVVTLQEKVRAIRLELIYTTFDQADVIARRVSLVNEEKETITLERLFSLQLDLPDTRYDLITFDGAWARERYRTVRHLAPGIYINDGKTGLSSSRHNPCIFLAAVSSDESTGDCYGCNLVYSGDHSETVEVSPYGKIRLLAGLNPAVFRWHLRSGDKFYAPEAILTFSDEGLNGASRNFHRFVNNHIVRGLWKFHQRPIAVNTWEAAYFDFTEHKLLELARAAANLGIELFILDDGWFGTRDDETSSLGDWTAHTKKFPSTLASFSKRIHQMGLLFGLWCEPEMVSRNSELYRQHPDWVVASPGRPPSVGRDQYLLDLSREDVRDYLFSSLSSIWKEAEVDYVKWDMNRTFSDMYSNVASWKQDEFNHRYLLGLYELLQRCVTEFPNILFESCAAGGNRFDLGMLCYMPQAWTSDNTDALCRMHIQEGTSCGYPLSAMVSHVTDAPNHQTLRKTTIESRFNVAAFGVLGYELDLRYLNARERKSVREQISWYKLHRSLFQYGEFFRLKPIGRSENQSIWVVASPDRSEMLALFFQTLAVPNPAGDLLRIPIADPNVLYAVTPRREYLDPKIFGSLASHISSLQTKTDTMRRHGTDSLISIDSEIEYYIVPGDVLAYGGIKLNQQFNGNGYDEETRVIGDFGSRLYYFKALST